MRPTSEAETTGGIERLHPLVVATRRELARQEPNKDGFCFNWRRGLRMRVSPAGQERALLIADRIIKEAERRGLTIRAKKTDEKTNVGGTCIAIDGREIELIIREEMKRFHHEPTEEEEVRAKKYSYYEPPRFDWRPTGNIFVVFEARFEPTVTIKEGLRWRQEDRIPRVFESLLAMAERAKQHDAELRRRHLEYEEDQKRLAQEAAERERENQRRESLVRSMTAWQQAQGIRAFVSVAQTNRREHPVEDLVQDEEFDRWANWALNYADKIDPLLRKAQCWPDYSIPT